MKHTPEQLNEAWDVLKKPENAVKSAEAENAWMPAHKIVVDDEVAQVISLPTGDGTDRDVYCRPPQRNVGSDSPKAVTENPGAHRTPRSRPEAGLEKKNMAHYAIAFDLDTTAAPSEVAFATDRLSKWARR